MVKNLQDYLKTGRDPAYLKNGDTITEELARELICAGDEDGCLDGEFEITQSRIVEDIIGGEGVYETIRRESPDHPWTYVGLCKAGMDKNLAPIHAKMTYVCSKYRAKNEVEMQQHIMDAMEACRTVHERGDFTGDFDTRLLQERYRKLQHRVFIGEEVFQQHNISVCRKGSGDHKGDRKCLDWRDFSA